MKYLFIVLFTVFICGCVKKEIQRYSDPISGNLAFLEFMNAGIGGPLVTFYSDSRDCTSRSFSRMSPSEKSKIHKITTDEPVSFSFAFAIYSDFNRTVICQNIATFKPMPNRHYLVRAFNNLRKCDLEIYEIEEGVKLHTKFIKRDKNTPWSDEGSWCEFDDLTELLK